MNLNKLKDLVLNILKNKPMTRNSDRLLYNEVCQEMGIDTHKITAYELLHDPDMPSTESVGRARRKAQEEHPELRAVEAVDRRRMERYSEFLEFARGY